MAENLDRHRGVPEAMRQVTQMSFLVRLAAVVIALLTQVGSALALTDILAILLLGGVSFAGLMHTRWLDVVRRHPMIALLDAAAVAAVVAFDGPNSPLILAALTTALLVGLWVDPRAGVIVITSLVLMYLVPVASAPLAASEAFLRTVVVPFVYVTLWLLGVTLARGIRSQRATEALVRDAVATAAAVEERTKVARELHDALAKTLQGMTLTATAIPTLIDRDQARARDSARDLQRMGALAVAQVREVMTGLRTRTSELSLAAAVQQIVRLWESDVNREVSLHLADVETTDETVRYELLSALEESLDNVRRHAGPCAVTVSLTEDNHELALVVEDDGRGVSPERLDEARRHGHHGVISLHERMARIGARCLWDSVPGLGTKVELRVARHGLVEVSHGRQSPDGG